MRAGPRRLNYRGSLATVILILHATDPGAALLASVGIPDRCSRVEAMVMPEAERDFARDYALLEAAVKFSFL